ncbi:hypothetical protein [Candidatus Nitrospira bockiana]
MSAVHSLMLDAKKAILEEQHRRFEVLRREGRWEEALRQLHVTLNCAADLLNDSIALLHHALPQLEPPASDDRPSTPPSESPTL